MSINGFTYKQEYLVTDQNGATKTADDVLGNISLANKRILITGVSAGLGIETARSLVSRGAHVIGTARDLSKARRAAAIVAEAAEAGTGSFQLQALDLADLTSVRSCAEQLLDLDVDFDYVIANAGVMGIPYTKTVDGFETQFATNYLGHFLLINKLALRLKDNARIIILSSAAHYLADVDIDDPNFEKSDYNQWLAYGRSKTACILLALELDRRLSERGIRAAAVHPGTIRTELQRHYDAGQEAEYIELTRKNNASVEALPVVWKTVEQGAATTVWAAIIATNDEVGGKYCQNCQVAETDTQGIPRKGVRDYALNAERARQLWNKGEELCGEKF
jgi:NAD(P)-dependent dehydrogenase (short-subunit alcohol dehydrogenase family)